MTAVRNEPAQAVMRRLGMTVSGYFDHPRIAAGHPLRPRTWCTGCGGPTGARAADVSWPGPPPTAGG